MKNNVEMDFTASDGIVGASKFQTLDDLGHSLYILELFEVQKYGGLCQRILINKASDSNSDFYEGDYRLLRHLHPIMPALQQIFISHSLRG